MTHEGNPRPPDGTGGSLLADPPGLPGWLREIALATSTLSLQDFDRFVVPPTGPRKAAVLMLFGESGPGDPHGPGERRTGDAGRAGDPRPDLLLIERASNLRNHAGQPALPGGRIEEGEGVVDAALREAAEETGLDPGGVDPLTTMPELYLPSGGFMITPVVAWWRAPTPISAHDPTEVASVHRIPLEDFLDPVNRLRIRHPSGFEGPGFVVAGLTVWGFTARLLNAVFEVSGLERPWDDGRVEDLPDRLLTLARATGAGRARPDTARGTEPAGPAPATRTGGGPAADAGADSGAGTAGDPT